MRYDKKLVIRVLIAIVLMAMPLIGLNLFDILQKPTMYLSYIPVKILGYNIWINGDLIQIGEHVLRFVSACTATSAYYLLAILILVTKDISLKKSLKMFLIGALLILAMNIIRIDILLIALMEKGVNMFESLHLVFWEVVSTLYVAALWIFLIKKFKIKTIPVVSDIQTLYKKASKKKY